MLKHVLLQRAMRGQRHVCQRAPVHNAHSRLQEGAQRKKLKMPSCACSHLKRRLFVWQVWRVRLAVT
jgi:hypothetical protein